MQNPPTWSKVCFRSCDSTTPLQTVFLKVDVWTRIHSHAPRRPGHPGCQSQREETPARRQQAEAPSDQCRDEGFLKVAMGKVRFRLSAVCRNLRQAAGNLPAAAGKVPLTWLTWPRSADVEIPYKKTLCLKSGDLGLVSQVRVRLPASSKRERGRCLG